jgi:hypothetical protein
MKNLALGQLQRQIEAVRREAYAEGYAAAMRQVLDFAGRPLDGAAAPRGAPTVTRCERPHTISTDRLRVRRPPHGTNARMVAAVLKSIAPRAARPGEIRHLLWREEGVALAFTSIRHALGQLTARHAAEKIAGSKTWRHLAADGAAIADGPPTLASPARAGA